MLVISMLGVAGFFILKAKNVTMCKRFLYCNAFNLMLFVSDIYRYVLIQISNISGDISLLKLIGVLNTDSVLVRKNCICDTLLAYTSNTQI